MHTWWNNDALLWDGVLSKAAGTPLLVSETGIMQRHRLSGEAVRSPRRVRGVAVTQDRYAFAAGAFGVIQWCYETNPFMNSDNEAAIGAKRVDGSAKPEHAALAAAAAFVARNRARFDGRVAPDVALVVPTSEHLSPRSLAAGATRAVVRAFYENLGIPLRAVADHRAVARPRTAAGHRVAGVPLDLRRCLGSDRGGCRAGSDADLFGLVRDGRSGVARRAAGRRLAAPADV